MDQAAIQEKLSAWGAQALEWLQSPAFLAQVGAIVLAIIIAPILARTLKKAVPFFRDPPAADTSYFKVRQIVYTISGFLRAILLVGILAICAQVLKSVPSLGDEWLVKLAQSLATVFLVYRAINVFLKDPLYRKIATYTLVPLALVFVLGYMDELTAFLDKTVLIPMGDSPITAMTLIKLAIFGSLFFWLGSLGNKKGQEAIRAQDRLDVGVREIMAKFFQIAVFAIVIFLVMGTANIPLSGLVMVMSAVGLGIGLGLQPIAANFVSGLIILFDRSVKVGDFVMMEDEKFGRIKSINMRSTTVATADGKDIIVPNTQFTESAYENWTHDSPLQRYEVDFSVSYDTDLDALVPLVRDAVLAHDDVLGEPDLPSVEFRSFGDSGINMCVEFWCMGVDDGPNKFTSDVGFIIWRTLKASNIEIPFPQRVIYQRSEKKPASGKSKSGPAPKARKVSKVKTASKPKR